MSYLSDRGGGKCVAEIGAVASQTIQFVCLNDRIADVSQGIPALVVGQYEDDVRGLGRPLAWADSTCAPPHRMQASMG